MAGPRPRPAGRRPASRSRISSACSVAGRLPATKKRAGERLAPPITSPSKGREKTLARDFLVIAKSP